MLWFQHCFVFLQALFIILILNFVFHYARFCTLCLLFDIAIIYQITIHPWHQHHKHFSLFFHPVHRSLLRSLFCFSLQEDVSQLHNLMYEILTQHLLQGQHRRLQILRVLMKLSVKMSVASFALSPYLGFA